MDEPKWQRIAGVVVVAAVAVAVAVADAVAAAVTVAVAVAVSVAVAVAEQGPRRGGEGRCYFKGALKQHVEGGSAERGEGGDVTSKGL